MNFKTTLVLLVLLVLVGGYIAWDRARSGGGGGTPVARRDEPKAERLLPAGFDAELIAFDLEQDGKPKTSLSKAAAASEWQMTAPSAVRADTAAVMAVVSRLASAESKGTPGPEAQAAFKPAVTVSFSRPAGAGKVAVSAPNAVGEAVARLDLGGKTIWHLVAGDLADALAKRPEELRDSRLVTANQNEIRLVTLEHGGRWVRLIRDDAAGSEGAWTLDEGAGPAPALTTEIKPGPVRADDAAVSDVLFALTGLRATSYPRNAAAAMVPAAQQLVVRYAAAGATTRPLAFVPREATVRFGRFEDARRERVIVSTDDVAAATVAAFGVTSLRKTALDLRDRRVLDVSPADVRRIEIVNETAAATRPAEFNPVVLTRAVPSDSATQPGSVPARWTLAGREADQAKVDALLESFRPLRAGKFLQGAAATQPVTLWRVTLTTAAGTTELRVGESMARLGELTFDVPAELLGQVSGSFEVPAKPIPFVEAGGAAPGPATGPTTQP